MCTDSRRILIAQTIPESTWAEVRVHYAHLCELLECINNTMAPVILLSCANNLYFICFQLLNCFEYEDEHFNIEIFRIWLIRMPV